MFRFNLKQLIQPIFCLLIICSNIKSQNSEERIQTLTDESFNSYKEKHDFMVIYFHAEWSNESKLIKQQFLRLPDWVETDKGILYGIVTSKNYLTVHNYNIDRFPSVVLINNDKFYLYKGEMKSNHISEWINNKINKKLVTINTPEDLDKVLEKTHVVISFIGEKQNFDPYLNLTETFMDLNFVHIDNLDFINQLAINENDKNLNQKIIIFKKFDDLINVYNSDFKSYEKLEKFIRTYSYPIINQFSQTNFLYIVNSQLSYAVLVLPNKNELKEDLLENIYDEYYNVAKNHRAELFFLYGNLDDQSQTTLSLDFEIEETELPVFVIQYTDMKDKIFKRYKEKVELDKLNEISEILNKYKYGALRRFLRSEKLPKQQMLDDSNVYNLVRKNFKELVVEKEDKWAIVYFTRRNCPQCIEVK